jgi:hypothetical protein
MAGSPNRGVIPNINAPDVRVPTEQELGFDAKGPGQITAGILDPVGAIFGVAVDQAAREARNRRYPGKLALTDEANAYMHAVGSYLLTRAVGPDRAKAMTDSHEVSGIKGLPIPVIGAEKNPEGERRMDLYNNQVGRELPPKGETAIQEAMKRGWLRKSPF